MNNHTLLIPVLLAALATAGCVSLGGGSSDSDSGSSAARSSDGSRSGPKVDDSEIAASIKTAFKQDPQLAAASINVAVEQGIVTLSGNVPGALVYNRAISVARSAPGVRPPVNAANLKF
jgi:hyperosmotically inducible protein